MGEIARRESHVRADVGQFLHLLLSSLLHWRHGVSTALGLNLLHVLHNLRMHGQHGLGLLADAFLGQVGLLDHLFHVFVIGRVREVANELASAEESTCLALKGDECQRANQEEASSVQRHSARLSYLRTRSMLVMVAMSIQLTTHNHDPRHCCGETWREGPLQEQKRQEPRQVLDRVTVVALVDIQNIPVVVRELPREQPRASVRIAPARDRCILADEHPLEVSKLLLHEVIVKSSFSMAHALQVDAVVLEAEQAAGEDDPTESACAHFERPDLLGCFVGHYNNLLFYFSRRF